LSYFDSPTFIKVQKIMQPQLMHQPCGCLCELSSVSSCANANSVHHHKRMSVSLKHMAIIGHIMAGTVYEMLGDRTLIPSGIQ